MNSASSISTCAQSFPPGVNPVEGAAGSAVVASTGAADGPVVPRKFPPWLKVRAPGGKNYQELLALVKEQRLHTVCESASCPNIGECWSNRTLTIMILGNICTRSCGFCDVATGRPGSVDEEEPERVAHLLSQLSLRHTVITSVDRDELKDGGARIWARTIEVVREKCPGMTIEVLIPDFKGREADMDAVFRARPDILAHNMETVPRLSRRVRPQAGYLRSLGVLQRARSQGLLTKSGMMLGLGETLEEVQEVMRDLYTSGCEIVTLGQYLRPSPRHLPVERFVTPEEFAQLREYGMSLGLKHVESGPLVRSSYHADSQAREHGRSGGRQEGSQNGASDPSQAGGWSGINSNLATPPTEFDVP